jgi:hypothetical protein
MQTASRENREAVFLWHDVESEIFSAVKSIFPFAVGSTSPHPEEPTEGPRLEGLGLGA